MRVGDHFAQLEVLAIFGPPKGQKNGYLYVRCTCGIEKNICRTAWRKYRSCGCTRYSRAHGATGTPEYRAWQAMRRRCLQPNDAAYSDYGGRGIRICARWASFANFLKDIGLRPTRKHRFDRRRVNGNYTPGNCRWVGVQESNLNRRNALRVSWQGQWHYLRDVAALYGISYCTARYRLQRGLLNQYIGERA